MKLNYVFLMVTSTWTSFVRTDINSGCPSWGCLQTGSFSLSASVPPANGVVKWSTEIVDVSESLDVSSLRGCVSGQAAVVCSTLSGYVSLDFMTGKQLWNYTKMNYPYLPIMDVYGDIIGMDFNQLVYVDRSGDVLTPIDISVLRPAFSLMLGNNSMLLLTSSRTNTQQVVTYNTNGIVCGAISLVGKVNNISGTFIPAGHPIIVGYRAYVITQFTPDAHISQATKTASGIYRLYALDLWDHMTMRIKIVWFLDLDSTILPRLNKEHGAKKSSKTNQSQTLPPVASYLRGTVYVNIPVSASNSDFKQPYQGTLWGIKDNGDTASILFKTLCAYGQMVVYDTDEGIKLRKKDNNEKTIWISSRETRLISGYSSRNGSNLGYINLYALANIQNITSKLAVTRQNLTSVDDVLVFGGNDANGTAYLVAIEINSTFQASVLLKTQLSGKIANQSNVTWEAVGQIVNTAQSVPDLHKISSTWRSGVVVMVLETGKGYNKLHIKAVY